MAKKSSVQKNMHRQQLAEKYKLRRQRLKKQIMDREITVGERFQASLKLAALPRNSAPNRYRNRCALTGRPRGVYRKFGLSRIALRELGNMGLIPGMIKSSW